MTVTEATEVDDNPPKGPLISRLAQLAVFLRAQFAGQLILLALLLSAIVIIALATGRYSIPFQTVLAILFDNLIPITSDSGVKEWKIVEERVVELVRLPRILVAGLCGAALSISDAALQGMFRNPLVGPQIIGVSSGAAFGGVLAILFMLPDYLIPVLAFVFGVVALLITMGVASAGGGKNVLSLVLGGIVTSAFFTSLVSLVKYTADPDDVLPEIVYWLLGSFNESSYLDVLYILIPALTAGFAVFKMRHLINILSLGEEEARSLGINVDVSRWIILLCCAILIAATVSVSGIVGWVGLIIPHFARMITGANHARLLPISVFSGAIYMILVDMFARTASYGEIPIGVLTALIGAPIFGWLLYRTQMKGWSRD